MAIRLKIATFLWAMAALLLPFACLLNPPEEEPESQPYEWEVASPAEQGLDSLQLSRADTRAAAIPGIASLLIVRNGYLVWEQYYNDYDKYNVWHLRSVTKSIISALVGIALYEGYLDSVDQRMADLLPEYLDPGLDSVKREITIKHLLTMTAGFEWQGSDDQFIEQWYSSFDWLEFGIERPLVDAPGTTFNYNSSLPHLLSAILTRQTEMSTLAFADKFLFEPLGITVTRWEKSPEGMYIGGFGLFLTPRDMARFGQLYVDGGHIDGQQIMPIDWIEESTRKHVSVSGGLSYGYGYLWWKKLFGIKNFVALGADGQMIYNFPRLRLVVVITAVLPNSSYMLNLDSLVKDYILPAVRSTSD